MAHGGGARLGTTRGDALHPCGAPVDPFNTVNGLLRTLMFAAAALCVLAAVVALAAPPSLWSDLGVPEPGLGQSLAPLGAAVIAGLIGFLLPRTRGVQYQGVRFYGEAPPPRIAKRSARPQIARKLQQKVRDDAAARVRTAQARR